MALFKDKLSEEDIKELLGMTPAELKTQLSALADLKVESAANSEQLKTLGAIKDSLAALEVRTRPVEKPNREEIEESPDFLIDPDAAMEHRIKNGIGKDVDSIKLATAGLQADFNLSIFRASHSDFKLYEKEFNEMWVKMHPAAKAQPNVIDNIYNMLRGRHLEDTLRDTAAGKGTFHIEVGGESGNKDIGEGDKTKPKLTDEEKQIAKAWDMTDAEYASERDGIVYA